MLLENLRQNYATMSKSHRKLADYLADNYHQVVFMTSSQLAAAVGVNGATVTRFAQKLGYQGYPELSRDLRALVQSEYAADTIESSAQHAELATLGRIGDSLHRLLQQLDALAVQQAQELLMQAPRIVVLAQGSAAPVSELLATFLRQRGKVARACHGDPYILADAVAGASPEMLVIGLGIIQESQEVAAALRFANQQNAPTLAIASSPTNPTVQAAQLAISWLADEANQALTITEAVCLMAALVLETPQSGDLSVNEQRLTGAVDAILGRRRRTS